MLVSIFRIKMTAFGHLQHWWRFNAIFRIRDVTCHWGQQWLRTADSWCRPCTVGLENVLPSSLLICEIAFLGFTARLPRASVPSSLALLLNVSTLGVSLLLSLFSSTSMPFFLATAMHELWSPKSKPATDILLHSSSHTFNNLRTRLQKCRLYKSWRSIQMQCENFWKAAKCARRDCPGFLPPLFPQLRYVSEKGCPRMQITIVE